MKSLIIFLIFISACLIVFFSILLIKEHNSIESIKTRQERGIKEQRRITLIIKKRNECNHVFQDLGRFKKHEIVKVYTVQIFYCHKCDYKKEIRL
jgi:hypothetical protein